MVLLKSSNIEMGFAAPNFSSLSAIDGNSYSLSDFADKKALVIIFMCVHCPYVQTIESEIVKIQTDFASQGVQVIGINPNDVERYPEDSLENMKARAQEMNYGDIVYLRDDSQQITKAYQAECTPDIYLFDQNRELFYHGRIEDLPGAINLILSGEPSPTSQFPSQGCSVKWRE